MNWNCQAWLMARMTKQIFLSSVFVKTSLLDFSVYKLNKVTVEHVLPVSQ
jgi:hypothetical protein